MKECKHAWYDITDGQGVRDVVKYCDRCKTFDINGSWVDSYGMYDLPGHPGNMSPARHYVEAEKLLEQANRYTSAAWPDQTGETKADILAEALVHATLATYRPRK